MAKQTDNRISYIKKPMAENSIPCIILSVVGLILCIIGLTISIRSQGETPLGAVSVCFSSLLLSGASVLYGRKAFKEKEKNYILAKIGTVAGGIVVILWFVLIMIGFRG